MLLREPRVTHRTERAAVEQRRRRRAAQARARLRVREVAQQRARLGEGAARMQLELGGEQRAEHVEHERRRAGREAGQHLLHGGCEARGQERAQPRDGLAQRGEVGQPGAARVGGVARRLGEELLGREGEHAAHHRKLRAAQRAAHLVRLKVS